MEVICIFFEEPLDLDKLLNEETSNEIELTDEDFEVASCNMMSFAGTHARSMVAWYKAGQT